MKNIFESPESVLHALEVVGYYTNPIIAGQIYHANYLAHPLLIEGPAGAGKTEMAMSISRATGANVVRMQCYEGLTDKDVVGDFNRPLQEMFIRSALAVNPQKSFAELRRETETEDFFRRGPLMEAILSEERTILLIDEIDKASEALEAMLLEVLSVWQMSVSGLGTVKARSRPLTIITSNDVRPLGDPLRRRSVYVYVEQPSPEQEAAIIAKRTPKCPSALHRFIAGFAAAVRRERLKKTPSISEMIDLALALESVGVTEIDISQKEIFMPLIVKYLDDSKVLLTAGRMDAILNQARINAQALEENERVNGGGLAAPVPGKPALVLLEKEKKENGCPLPQINMDPEVELVAASL